MLLEKNFGVTINSKGFKVLNNVRLIQGDGINVDTIKSILERINSEGFSTTNLAFGQGGGSLQSVNRDTYKMAIKCSSVIVDQKEVDVFKDPITDPGKKSKKGKLDLIYKNNKYQTVRIENSSNEESKLRTVFENGNLLIEESFDSIRNRVV